MQYVGEKNGYYNPVPLPLVDILVKYVFELSRKCTSYCHFNEILLKTWNLYEENMRIYNLDNNNKTAKQIYYNNWRQNRCVDSWIIENWPERGDDIFVWLFRCFFRPQGEVGQRGYDLVEKIEYPSLWGLR